LNRGRVVILHSHVPAGAPKDELDVLDEVAVVRRALESIGYEALPLPFVLNIEAMADTLNGLRPLFVFNLVETVCGAGELIPLAPIVLDYLRIPYTGCPKDAIYLTSNKVLAKRLMHACGVATPPWVDEGGRFCEGRGRNGAWLVKSVWEHASIGLREDSVLRDPTDDEILRALRDRRGHEGREYFAEQYIEGREFNLSLLAGEVLPVPEIRFLDYPDDKLKMVDYRAKWEEETFEYQHTQRTFAVAEADQPLLRHLSEIARDCWRIFELRGYARIDFRVDTLGQPWVLEVNSNPGIAPDSGFQAACERAGLPFERVVERIIADSLER
jgi:D-alanine-D-alanine ligase